MATAMRQPVPQNPTPDQPASLVPQGRAQANQLASTRGTTADYMAARGARPVGGLGVTQQPAPASMPELADKLRPGLPQSGGFADHASALANMMNAPGLPDGIKAALQQAHDHFSSGPDTNTGGDVALRPGAQPGMRNRNRAPMPPAATPAFKGRTTSMQRRGVGVGQPLQAPKPAPVTPANAAQDFLRKGLTVPTAQPQVTPQPVTTAGPVATRAPVTPVAQPAPTPAPVAKPVTV